MKDTRKTKTQLIDEMKALRARIVELEGLEAEHHQEMERLPLIAEAAEQSTEGMAVVDLEGNIIFLNKAFAKMHGYDPDELVGRNLSLFHTPEQMPSVDAANREVRVKGTFRGEVWHARRDGTVFPTWMENSLFRDPGGNPIGMIGTLGDITELKRTEEALRESEARFRELAAHIREVFWVFDYAEQRVIYVSPVYEEIWGRSIQDLYARYGEWADSIHPEDVAYAEESFAATARSAGGEAREYRIVRPDGTVRWISDKGYVIRGDDGEVVRIAGVAEDITDRKRTEADLKESEKNYRNLVENALVGIFRRSIEGDLFYVNQALAEMVEYDSVEELRSAKFEDVYEDPQERHSFVEELNQKGKVVGYELRLLTKTGKTRSVLVNGMIEDGIMSGMMMDITERKAMEEELRRNAERDRAMFEGSLDAILLTDPQSGQVIDANPAASELFSRSRRAIIGLQHAELYPLRIRQGVIEAFAGIVNDRDQDQPIESTVLWPDGNERQVEAMAHLIQIDGRLVVYQEFRDISDRKRMEQEMGNIQRLQALGVLAGGIAHDFNNILTAILANVSMARLYGEFEDDLSQMLADAEKASLRAQGLTHQLLTFAKGGEPIKKHVRLSVLLQESAAFALSGSNSRCEYLMPEDIRRVEADEGQLIQVFQNLVINADQAMPEGGVIKIRAENVRIKKNEKGDLKEGDYAKVS